MRAPAPADFAPPVSESEFLRAPGGAGDDPIEAGVVVVGAGPAGLACALRLSQLLERTPELAGRLGQVPVAVLEKSRVAGGHQLSGAVMDPSGLRELLPAVAEGEWPHWGVVERDFVRLLVSKRRSLALRPVPPPFRNRGNYVVSLSELTRWLAGRVEQAGVPVLYETPAVELLVHGGRVRGVRTGDRGSDAAGRPGRGYAPGAEIRARATVLCEGAAGHLAGAAISELGLARGREPQVWALGVKEVWELERPFGGAAHTLGWPLRPGAGHREVGGAWLYGMNRPGEPPMASVGFVAGLGHVDSELSVHDLLQQLKGHPLLRSVLDGGRRVGWGAKAIPEGGWWALPRLHAPGLALAGDAAGMVDVPRLKGIHHAVRAGRLAAERIHAALLRDSTDFSAYEAALVDGPTGRDLRRARNSRQALERGLPAGLLLAGAMELSGGRLPGGRWRTRRDADVAVAPSGRAASYPRPDGELFFDKASSVWLAAQVAREDAPNHIRVASRVPRALGEAWASMCPAAVYEIAPVPGQAQGEGMVDVRVTASNCVQCGAISAKGGRLTPPEGGLGPAQRLG